jgi:hypothetical protein
MALFDKDKRPPRKTWQVDKKYFYGFGKQKKALMWAFREHKQQNLSSETCQEELVDRTHERVNLSGKPDKETMLVCMEKNMNRTFIYIFRYRTFEIVHWDTPKF